MLWYTRKGGELAYLFVMAAIDDVVYCLTDLSSECTQSLGCPNNDVLRGVYEPLCKLRCFEDCVLRRPMSIHCLSKRSWKLCWRLFTNESANHYDLLLSSVHDLAINGGALAAWARAPWFESG